MAWEKSEHFCWQQFDFTCLPFGLNTVLSMQETANYGVDALFNSC